MTVVGGVLASACEHADVVSVGDCTGVLVGERAVVTAAHCVANATSDIRVGFGEQARTPARTLGVKRCVVHPEYDASRDTADIATCLLEASAGVGPSAIRRGAIALAPGQPVTTCGFGSARLGEAGDTKRCAATVAGRVLEGGVLLAGEPERTICNGDSGGPLYAVDGDVQRVAAIALSAGRRPCMEAGKFLLLEPYVAWIESVAGALASGPTRALEGGSWQDWCGRGEARRPDARSVPAPPGPAAVVARSACGVGEARRSTELGPASLLLASLLLARRRVAGGAR